MPAAAQAGTGSASVFYGVLNYNAAAGDANHVVATKSGSTVTLTDTGSGVAIAPSYGCAGSGSTVTCSGAWGVRLSVGDGDNFVDTRGLALGTTVLSGSGADTVFTGIQSDYLSTGAGADVLDPGAAADTVYGGAGADVINARDASVDRLHCGADADSGKADPTDAIDADCESLATTDPPSGGTEPAGGTDSGSQPGTGGRNGGGTTTPARHAPANLAPPVLPAQTAGVSSKGVARVRVGCPAGAGRCKGRVDLLLVAGHIRASAAAGKVSAARRRTGRRIGRAKFSVAAGRSVSVPVKLNRRGRRRVMRHRRKVRVKLVVTTHTATGRTVKTSRTISLRRRAARRGRH